MNDGYQVQVLARAGKRVLRLHFTRAHAWFAAALVLAVVIAFSAASLYAVRRAERQAAQARSTAEAERERLSTMDLRARELDGRLRRVQQQDAAILRLLGAKAAVPSRPRLDRQSYDPSDAFTTIAERIERLRHASAVTTREDARLRTLAYRVLDVRRMRAIARTRMLAAIPSLNPAGEHVAIRSPYGWRALPWPEFHQGVDLDVDYGQPVRAAATGTVAAAGYDGGYGLKVDLDHGNGYHTWYCHLSRIDVVPGREVRKGDRIALVGSTGVSTGPHLHYQIELDGRTIDPTPYLAGIPAPVLAGLK